MTKISLRVLSGLALLTAALSGSTGAAAARIHLQSGLEYSFTSSTTSATGSTLNERVLGPSIRVRAAFPLMSRQERDLEAIVGLGWRFGLLFTPTGFGSDVTSSGLSELIVEAGLAWFGKLRTLITIVPSSNYSFDSAQLTAIPGTPVHAVARHWSVGLRAEFPLILLESDPGDRRMEIGLSASYLRDHLHSFLVTPLDTASGLTETSVSSTQDVGWKASGGVFVNVRL